MTMRDDPPSDRYKRPRVRDSELEACADEAHAAAKAASASTPPATRARDRATAISKLTAWAKELAPRAPDPRFT